MSASFKPQAGIVKCHGSVILPYSTNAKNMFEHNALGHRSSLALCLTKVRSSRARCPATDLIFP